eukprot:6200237-Pleurochrysis_carterae.AAC.1
MAPVEEALTLDLRHRPSGRYTVLSLKSGENDRPTHIRHRYCALTYGTGACAKINPMPLLSLIDVATVGTGALRSTHVSVREAGNLHHAEPSTAQFSERFNAPPPCSHTTASRTCSAAARPEGCG